MKQVFRIAIPKPCHENWETMHPNEKGRHCMACEKTVVDFSTWSDENIINYLRKASGSTCGRLSTTQLERKFIPKTFFQKYISSRLIKVAAMLVLLLKLKRSDAQIFRKGKVKHCEKPPQEIVDSQQIDGKIILEPKGLTELTGDTVLAEEIVKEEYVRNADGVLVKKEKKDSVPPIFILPEFEQPMVMGGAIAWGYERQFDFDTPIYAVSTIEYGNLSIVSAEEKEPEVEGPVDLNLPHITPLMNKEPEPAERKPLRENPNRNAVISIQESVVPKKKVVR